MDKRNAEQPQLPLVEWNHGYEAAVISLRASVVMRLSADVGPEKVTSALDELFQRYEKDDEAKQAERVPRRTEKVYNPTDKEAILRAVEKRLLEMTEVERTDYAGLINYIRENLDGATISEVVGAIPPVSSDWGI